MLGAPQTSRPCEIHDHHSPVTVLNEEHHPFPQAWQRHIWGEVRDDRTTSVCATGHNTVHEGIKHKIRHGVYPSWCVGRTRNLAERAFELRALALAGTPEVG